MTARDRDELLTPRLRLRRARKSDLDDLHVVFASPLAMRYWSTPPHDRDQTRAFLEAMMSASPQQSDDFVVEHEGRVIGKAGCWRIPEVGFILHPDFWGQGLAHEALVAVIQRAFARFPIAALEADVDPRNAACLGLLAKLGFEEVRRVERTTRVGAEWVDSVYLSLRRPQASA